MSEHTPGPWKITGVSMQTGNISVGCPAQRIVIADVTNAASFGDLLAGAMNRSGGKFKQSDARTQYANADLIAAAPDMFEAGTRVLDYATLDTILADPKRHDNEVFGIRIGDLRVLAAAISKASGKGE